MLGKLLVEGDAADLPWFDINTLNLVAEVSIKVTIPTLINPGDYDDNVQEERIYNRGGRPKICAVDCGLKMNQV